MTDCRTHLVLAAVPGRGPGSDLVQFKAALKEAAGRARIGTLLADADYDAEWVHEHVRDDYGIRTVIPAERGRPSDKPPAGRWRRWMRRRLDKKYGQRWQTEVCQADDIPRCGLYPSARPPHSERGGAAATGPLVPGAPSKHRRAAAMRIDNERPVPPRPQAA